MNLPQARTTDLVVQDLGAELLVYDLLTNQAFNLNETSKIVFDACNSKTSFDKLKRNYHFTDDLIYFAIDELRACNLIESETGNHFGNLTRREIIRKVGLASIIALPIISVLVAPTAANAASFTSGSRTLNQTCNSSTDCASSAPRCSNLQNGSQVCCSGSSATVQSGGTYIGIYQNCNSCASTYAPEFCCSGQNAYTGTCTTNANGTGSCQYRCT